MTTGPASAAPPPLPQRRRRVLKRVVVIIALFYAVLLAFPALSIMRYASTARSSFAVSSLHQASAIIHGQLLDGATMDEAVDSARLKGFTGPDAAWPMHVNPDRAAWLDQSSQTGPGTAPIVLIVDHVFEDCSRAPGGEGKRGYYGIATTLEIHYIPENELPGWARP